MKERHMYAQFIVSGYSMILKCQFCMAEWEIAIDGPKCYETARRGVRKAGWIIHKDGFCTCSKCK